MSKKFLIFKIFVLSVILTSCASNKFEAGAVLTGRICNPSGAPIPNYHVSLGIGQNAVTDYRGMFSFSDVSSGTYKISGGAVGWCGIEEKIDFYDRKSILCLQVEPLESILPKIERSLLEENVAEAREILSKSKKFNEKNQMYLCIKKLIDFCAVPSEKNRENFLSAVEKI